MYKNEELFGDVLSRATLVTKQRFGDRWRLIYADGSAGNRLCGSLEEAERIAKKELEKGELVTEIVLVDASITEIGGIPFNMRQVHRFPLTYRQLGFKWRVKYGDGAYGSKLCDSVKDVEQEAHERAGSGEDVARLVLIDKYHNELESLPYTAQKASSSAKRGKLRSRSVYVQRGVGSYYLLTPDEELCGCAWTLEEATQRATEWAEKHPGVEVCIMKAQAVIQASPNK